MSASISFNPLELIKWFRERDIKKKEAVCDYLEQMASDAETSADMWTSKLTEVLEREPHQKSLLAAIKNQRLFSTRIRTCHVLDFHYGYQTSVRHAVLNNELREQVFMKLGCYLKTRDTARRIYEQVAYKLVYSVRISESTLDLAREIIDALNRDAAELRVLTSVIRATVYH